MQSAVGLRLMPAQGVEQLQNRDSRLLSPGFSTTNLHWTFAFQVSKHVKTCQNEETNDKKGMKPEHFARPHQHSQGRLNLIIQRMHRHRATQR